MDDLAIISQNTPQCLRGRRQWVCWRHEKEAGGGKDRKVPCDPKTGRPASYDATTRTLYVYCQWGSNLSSYILAYKVSAHPGDADGDNRVNVDDLGILTGNYGLAGKIIDDADFTGDRVVNVDDLGVLVSNYDWVLPGGNKNVPEPATALLLAVAMVLAGRRRRGV